MGLTGVLDFERVGSRTVLKRAYARNPLRFLTPRNLGTASWVYTSSFGGGLVDGDAIDVGVRVRTDAEAVLLSQASTKVYRSPRGCSQRVEATVERGGFLAVTPDPVVCFAGANYAQSQRYDLEEGASLLVVETVSAGRHASGERWVFDAFRSRIEVRRAGVPVFLESLRLDGEPGSVAERSGRFNYFALVLMFGPELERVALPCDEVTASLVRASSALTREGRLVRLAATTGEELAKALRRLLDFLPGRLGDDPWARKW